MAYVKPIGFNPVEIDYRLGEHDSCSGSDRERPLSTHPQGGPMGLLWIGQGLREVGIAPLSPLTRDQFPQARALATGRHPHTGEVLVEPRKAVPEDAKLPISPLVRAVRGIAAQAGVPVSEVLAERKLRDMFATAERVWRADGETARLRADHAGLILDAVGLAPDEVWQPGAFTQATANLFTIVQTTGHTGKPRNKRVPRRVITGNAAYDLTVDIPKSDSTFLAIATPELAAQAEPMFLQQVLRTFDWLEARTAYGMRGKHGQGKTAATVPGSGFLGWAMVERTARPVEGMPVGDPHWHVHLTLTNMTRGIEDGKWSTIAAGGRDLIRHAPVVQHMVHALIRHQMSTRFGVRYRRSERTGRWEIAGIPDETLRQFSKRNTDIRALLTHLGHDPQTATRVQQDLAARLTRRPKHAPGRAHGDYIDAPDATLQDIWQGQELAAGRDPAEHLRRVLAGGHLPEDGEQPEPEPVVTAETIAQRLLDPAAGLTSHSRRFTRADALRHVADAMPGGYPSPEAIEAMTDRVLAHLDFVRLPQGAELVHGVGAKRSLAAQHMANAQQFTTSDVVEAEKIILRAARASHPEQSPVRVTDPDLLQMALDTVDAGQGYPLSDEQRTAVTRLATDGRMIDTVNGAPGTGKTTLLRALRTILEAAGYVVQGAATAAVAARNLQAESGIPARTLTSLLSTAEDPDSTVLTGVDVLVIDEANLTDDRDRARLYQRAAHTGTRIIEVGDKLQLRGVGAGSLFGHVHRLVDGPELVDNRRQREEDEREAIALWREGRYSEALAIWMLKNRLVATDTTSEATAAMLATWAQMRAGAPDPHTEIRGLVMLSATRDMVDRLNHGAQALRLADDELGASHTYALRRGGEIRIHVGDHVLMRINAVQRRTLADTDVLNGYRAVVTAIADDGTLTVEWQEDAADGRTTRLGRLTPEYIARGGVSLGYAMTVHKSEGLTVGDQWRGPDGEWSGGTVLFHAAGADNPAAHVATSRHRSAVHLFAPLDALDAEREATNRPEPRTRAERMERAVEKLARRARATETSPDDLPVVVQLGLTEFRELTDAQAREQRSRDAEAAAREADRRRRERAERSTEAKQARAERDQRLRDRAAELLRDVWRHEPALVERIIAAAAFSSVARRLAEVEDSALNVHEVLAQVPLRTVASDAVTDPAAFTAWAVRDASERLADGRVDAAHEQAERRRQWQLMRDQVADLVRETWTARPELAEAVITSSTFDAVVRQLDRHAVGGLDARTLLARVPLAKVGRDNVEDPARLTAYFIKRTASAHQWEADKAQRNSDRAAAERHRRRTAVEHLRQAWPDHPEVVDLVAGGPAFGALAQRIEQAAEAGIDVDAALRQVSPTEVSARWVKNPSAFTTSHFQRAAQHQIELAGRDLAAADQQPHPRAPEAQGVPHWADREHGRHDDEHLRRLLAVEQQRLAALDRAVTEARHNAEELRIQVTAEAGPAVRTLDDHLHRLREQADLVRQADDLETRWHAALERAENAAADRARTQHALDTLGPLARTRRTELSEQVKYHAEREEQAHADARDLAAQAARLHERTGPPDQRRHTLTRANAAEKDYEHARPRAQQRDLDALTTAQDRAERLAAEHHSLTRRIGGLRDEIELRAGQPAEIRERERQERHTELASVYDRASHAPERIAEHHPHVDDVEPPHAGGEIEPEPGDR